MYYLIDDTQIKEIIDKAQPNGKIHVNDIVEIVKRKEFSPEKLTKTLVGFLQQDNKFF